MTHSTPPHSIEAEKGVLGSMIQSPSEAIPEAARHLNQFHFHNPVHRTIFNALVETHRDEGGIDLITFTQALRDRGKLEEVGGAAYVTELSIFVPCAANLRSYVEIILEKYALREIIVASTEAVRRAYEPRPDVGETVAFLAQQLDAIKWKNGSGLQQSKAFLI